MKTVTTLAAFLLLATAPVLHAETDGSGTLNPEELTLNTAVESAAQGKVGMVVCAQGYFLTKSGRHAAARVVFKNCAEAGYTAAMTWMAQLEENGLGGPQNSVAAARWDRRAADAGDPIGMFNYGLNLLRGRGVARDLDIGRQYIDSAADNGLRVAQQLQAADYDLEVVTPDADAWRYELLY